MNYPYVDRFDFSLLSKAFMAGLVDSIHSGNLATVLIFITFLSFIGTTSKRIVFLGALFLTVTGMLQFLSVMGTWDYLLSLSGARFLIRVIYLLIAAVFLFLGIAHILDWRRYKKHLDIGCFRLKLPDFFKINGETKPETKTGKTMILVLISSVGITILVSFIVTLMSTIFPQGEHIFIVHSFWMAGGDRIFVNLSFFLYSIAMVLPLFISWLIILWITLGRKQSARVAVYYKGILSALFLSTGAGLGYYFLR